MLNAFGWRSTDPGALYDLADPVGPGNDEAILREASKDGHPRHPLYMPGATVPEVWG